MLSDDDSDVFIVAVLEASDCICLGPETERNTSPRNEKGKGKAPANGRKGGKKKPIVVEDSLHKDSEVDGIALPLVSIPSSSSLLSSKVTNSVSPKPAKTTSINNLADLAAAKAGEDREVLSESGPPEKKQHLIESVHDPACSFQTKEPLCMVTSAPQDGSTSTAENYIDTDYQLALKFVREEMDSFAKMDEDEQLAKRLQEEEYGLAGVLKNQLSADERLAKQLQSEEDASVKVVKATKVVVNPSAASSSKQSATVPTAETSTDTSRQPLSNTCTSSSIPSASNTPSCIQSFPSKWTQCPKCRPDATRRFHVIDLIAGSEEWNYVSAPLDAAGFTVQKVQRIQNPTLLQRFQSEKQLMAQGRPAGSDINEKLLYHTSRAEKGVICEEGLDQRLSSGGGNFGTGIYFSDDPRKCNAYWSGSKGPRLMFACAVLLGDIKVYPRGQTDPKLRREPEKEKPQQGEPKYDSVLGNLGFNEYVVYNMYRVLPEYVLEYAYSAATAAAIYTPTYLQSLRKASRRSRGRRRIPVSFSLPPVPPAPPVLPAPPVASGPPMGLCYLCNGDPTSSCRCGLTYAGLCKYCQKHPLHCSCPPYTSSTGDVVPYRCLTPPLQSLLRIQAQNAITSSSSQLVPATHPPLSGSATCRSGGVSTYPPVPAIPKQ